MSDKRKVCVVITARPSYSRIKTALKAILEHPDLELQLVVAASALLDRYGTAVNYIEKDGFPIAARVYMVLEGENPASMAKTTGLGMLELATVFDNLRPDVVVTIADRFETLATAVAASYMNIPVAHIQGGEVTGSIDEKVRHAVTKLADIHLVSTRGAAERVRRMGEEDRKVFVTGCPSIDLAAAICDDPSLGFNPFERYGGVGDLQQLDNGYLVVMQHPVTTEHEKARQHVMETLEAIYEFDIPTLWFWPNVDAGSDGTSNGIRSFREKYRPKNLHFFKNMEPSDFLRLLYNSRCLIGNSSVGIRECSFLGVPVVNIGTRQHGRERGSNVIDVGYSKVEIQEAMQKQFSNGRYEMNRLYGDGNAGEAISDVLAKAPLEIDKRLTY
ncbi:MAG: UDP-N-acetylglucosamine 2-epimerase (hydrolyzing) [Acidobacteria bacterium]|mgnify:CR=1 FL=1|nr:MAG: UDP-N-acetylglucosamine 2-epimerase (hydrolyzing) [Acidobacteriota bacterium]REK01495.1 MAG: UDP-N-acetylglucosamine 2-epimerase (hydrolyzing) [Acidobacteriota bacterium]REK14451.1 MAG: UDP-N-acetylglucosamine 2-epimerase (hydrolyzing) [Acidobacteriota bacterium]REK45166.1 MAG: UDP-N-acetylglucosamine 2-epimerase (hydrolyzing) [Acidobacteriota bacterium]